MRRGAHGEVRLVCARGSGVARRYALKTIDTQRLTTLVQKSADTEEKIASLLQGLEHVRSMYVRTYRIYPYVRVYEYVREYSYVDAVIRARALCPHP